MPNPYGNEVSLGNIEYKCPDTRKQAGSFVAKRQNFLAYDRSLDACVNPQDMS